MWPAVLLVFVVLAFASVPQAHAAPVAPPPSPSASEASPAAAAQTPPVPVLTPTSPSMDSRAARLFRLCKIWGAARYQDPRVVTGELDWDAALLSVLPKALAAQTDEDEVAAAKALLEALHDPASHVTPGPDPHEQRSAANAAEGHAATHTVDGVTVIPVSADSWQGIQPAAERLVADLQKAKLAVVDLRVPGGEVGQDNAREWMGASAVDSAAPHLTPHASVGVAQRLVEHRGYRPQTGVTSGQYQTLLATVLPAAYPASREPHPSRVVFLVDGHGPVPEVAWAMQRAGDAVVVVHGARSPDQGVWTHAVDLPGGSIARVRIAEAQGPTEPDLVLEESMSADKVEQAAVRAAQHPPAAKRAAARAVREAPLAWHPDATYADELYPSREKRLLGLFRFWSVIHYFYPYLRLMGDDAWDSAVAEMLPRFESAADAREYALAVGELAARIPDTHVHLSGSEAFERARGEGRAPFDVRIIEDQVVVTGIRDAAALGDSKLAVGDVIVAADGVPIRERMAREATYIAASNDTTREARSAQGALRGDPSAKLALTMRGADGRTRDVVVARGKSFGPVKRAGPVYRLLDGGIGYADLDRLEVSEVGAMFSALENAPAIVFDMRGYPHGTAWAIAPRLNVRKARFAAQFFEPFVSPGDPSFTFFEQELPKTDKPLYRGKTVMLIDERTISQAEHTGLFFEVANGTTFIGSQTAGANGDVTTLSLPGGLFVHFTGHDVRHADGRQLQRVGLVPDIPVKPTIEGLRAGRDEVLERALAFLQGGK